MKTIKIFSVSVAIAIIAIYIVYPETFALPPWKLVIGLVVFAMLFIFSKKFQRRIKYNKNYVYWGQTSTGKGKLILSVHNAQEGRALKEKKYLNPAMEINTSGLRIGGVYSFTKEADEIEIIRLVLDPLLDLAGIDCPVIVQKK